MPNLKAKQLTFSTKGLFDRCSKGFVFLHLVILVLWTCDVVCGIDSYKCPSTCQCELNAALVDLKVDCTGQNFTSVPTDLDENTVILILSKNNITALPDRAFSDYRRLAYLHLTNNMLSGLPPNVFDGLKNLLYLVIEGNRLKSVPRKALRGLVYLETLYLGNNRISEVHENSFKPLRKLLRLRLDQNQLTEIPVKAFNMARTLKAIDLTFNNIDEIPDHAFSNLTDLSILVLSNNRISHIGTKAFDGLPVLSSLELNNNRLTEVPAALKLLPDLFDLTLRANSITHLPNGCFSGNRRKLTVLKLTDNPITSIGNKVFANLPELDEIVLSEAREVEVFPDLTGTNKLKTIILDRAAIRGLPDNICHSRPDLTVLDVHSNHISVIPNMTDCFSLTLLNLGNNDISSLENAPLEGLVKLKDLILNYNKITHISSKAFAGLMTLQYLDLSFNSITYIHPDAFATLDKLEDLNLGENKFSSLPTKGLKNLRYLKTFHNRYLEESPTYESLPNIMTMVVAYAYHCCDFIRKSKQQGDIEGASYPQIYQDIDWLMTNDSDFWDADDSFLYDDPLYDPIYDDPTNCSIDGVNITNCTDREGPSYAAVDPMVKIRPPVECSPVPDPFQPCDDLFGWWSLRCGVWVVFLLAVLGNGTVLFVSLFSKSKLDVTRFLICNLALSDLCMGVYLGFLAIVDASTLGEFEKYAVRWQSSPGCLVAGFLGVLSSELSVFTLVVITVERFYAISHSMQLGKRVRLGQAGIVMACGWVLCAVIAGLPLFQISDYRVFAICLPFETENNISLAYVCFIMLFNALSFLIIVICYGGMFVSIRASHSWNSKDTVVAKRMALLVFTDFFCWAPIIFFSLTAAFGWEFAKISLDEAKVLTIFVLPLNSCANPFLYAFFTRQFKRDCVKLCKRIEESSISRHLSSSGLGRSSTVQHRQIHGTNHRTKRGSCDQLMNEPTTSGEPSSSSNNASDDSDLTFRKLHFTSEERQILRYVRAENTPARPVRLITEDSFDKHCPGYLNLVPVRRSLHMTSPPKGIIEDDGEAGDDVILHTNDGNVYLSAKSKSTKGLRKKSINTKGKSNDDLTNKCAKRLCHHAKTTTQSSLTIPVECRSVESQTVEPTESIASKVSVAPRIDNRECVRTKFEAERSKQLGLKIDRYVNQNAQTNAGDSDLMYKTTATQTDLNYQMPSAQIYNLQRAIAKREKDKHINEWRKTSHLSFLWRHSGTYDAVTQKQKSNSLVELTRPIMQNSSTKRHSLTSKHEGYILLKNTSRDSAYEDDDMYEFYEPRVVSRDNQPQKKLSIVYKNAVFEDGFQKQDVSKKENFSSKNEEICETTILLTDNLCLPKNRNSCDNESGISSSS